jgi:hypothetical protein
MPSDRTDFLREYYRLLTDDIRRSEAIIPKVCALEAAFVVLLVASRWGHGPTYLPPLLVLLTSTWAMHMLINANLWARRSHLMAANVEQEFFTLDDMDVLLPRSYYTEARRYRYRRVFRAPLLLSAAFFVIGLSTLPIAANLASLSVLLLVVLFVWSLYFENRRCAREYAHLAAHARGRSPDAADSGSDACAS